MGSPAERHKWRLLARRINMLKKDRKTEFRGDPVAPGQGGRMTAFRCSSKPTYPR